jgi:hypothetical protein
MITMRLLVVKKDIRAIGGEKRCFGQATEKN